VLWLAMTGMRLGSSDWAAQLEEQSKGLHESWPMPVIQFYRGGLTVDRLILAARNSNKMKKRNWTCMAVYFMGEWQLSHGQRRDANANLRRAKSKCPHTNVCYRMALDELKNLETIDTEHGH
jgi:lipoprotein NlpI